MENKVIIALMSAYHLLLVVGCSGDVKYQAESKPIDVIDTHENKEEKPPLKNIDQPAQAAETPVIDTSAIPPAPMPLDLAQLYGPSFGRPIPIGFGPVSFGGSGAPGKKSLCGDGEKEGREQCDDGNKTDNDGCSALCQREESICGDGIVQVGEFCDDGGQGPCVDCTFVEVIDVGEDLELEEAEFALVDLGFSFPFQGEGGLLSTLDTDNSVLQFSSAYVNANGTITFGSPDNSADSVPNFLAGPPRLAPLWDQYTFDPGASVSFTTLGNFAIFTWQSVREAAAPNAPNSFQVQLNSTGSVIFIFQSVNSGEALTGITPGNNAPNPGQIDYTDVPLAPEVQSTNVPTNYERFMLGNPVDLDNQILHFSPHTSDSGWDISRTVFQSNDDED